jgi:hypothetical protein
LNSISSILISFGVGLKSNLNSLIAIIQSTLLGTQEQ